MKLQTIRSGSIGVSAANMDVQLLNTLRGQEDALTMHRDHARMVFASESINESQAHIIESACSNFTMALEKTLDSLNLKQGREASIVAAAESAAVMGALAVNAGSNAVQRQTGVATIGQADGREVFAVSAEGVPGYNGKRNAHIVAAVEAFDQREQRQAALYTMAYNYAVSLQSEFGETLYPLLTLPADQIGFGIIVNRLTVHKGLVHDVTGRAKEIQKIDLVRAPVDASVLSRTKNQVFPIHRASSAAVFADGIAPVTKTVEGVSITTAPLKVGVEFNLIGLAQTDAQLATGAATQTDTLDPAVSLDVLYVKVGDDVIAVNVYGRHSANFVYNQQGRPEDRRLNFRSKYVVLPATQLTYDGAPLVTLAALAASKLSVVLDVAIDGTINTEFGSGTVHGPRVSLVRVLDENNNVVPSSNAAYQDIAAAVATATVVGFDLRAYKTNVNLRERGDFIDRSQFVQLYEVPLLSPITCQRPLATNGEHDASDYETLVTTTRFRLLGDAVTAVLEAVDRLRAFTLVPFTNEDAPQGLGAARFHVKPYLADLTGDKALDVQTLVSTLDNVDAPKNVAAAIINKLRDIAFSMYVMSEYESAQLATGFIGETTLVIATDPYLRRYLQIDGEVRVLTEKFNVKIVDTLDKRFRGKIFMTFGVFNESRNQTPNILNWGNLIWSPEVVVSANIPRGDSMQRETIVQPRYRFVEHLPVGALVEVKNVDKVFDQSYLQVKQH